MSKRTIDILRAKFPGKWKYDGHGSWSRDDGAAARWCGTIRDDGDLGGPSHLYFYPTDGSPVLV